MTYRHTRLYLEMSVKGMMSILLYGKLRRLTDVLRSVPISCEKEEKRIYLTFFYSGDADFLTSDACS